MFKAKANYFYYLLLLALIVFTVALGVNIYNSGVYADAHGLDGGSVGWFSGNVVLVFIVSALATITFGAYLLSHRSK